MLFRVSKNQAASVDNKNIGSQHITPARGLLSSPPLICMSALSLRPRAAFSNLAGVRSAASHSRIIYNPKDRPSGARLTKLNAVLISFNARICRARRGGLFIECPRRAVGPRSPLPLRAETRRPATLSRRLPGKLEVLYSFSGRGG